MWLAEKYCKQLTSLFDAVFVTAIQDTSSALLDLLRSSGIHVQHLARSEVGNTYFQTMQIAHNRQADVVFHLDFDRVLHWMEFYPEEFRDWIELGEQYPFFIAERTPRAYQYHHEALFVTEQAANMVISHILHTETHDFLSSGFVLSKAAHEIIAALPVFSGWQLFGAWPVALHNAGFSPTFKTFEGLEWETPDRFREDVVQSGGLDAWRRAQSSPDEWKKRTLMAQSMIEGAFAHP